MAKVLAVGVATLDIINSVPHYPGADEELRITSQRICRGGNATNTLVVLSQLGHQCEWAGVLAEDMNGKVVAADLERNRIGMRACAWERQGTTPVSYVTLCMKNGTRSIVHFRDLREFNYSDFIWDESDQYDWIHFEGRNVNETERMLRTLRENTCASIVSLEIEKPRSGIEYLWPLVDVLLFSRQFVEQAQTGEAAPFLKKVQQSGVTANLVCAWGKQGAYVLDSTGESYFCAAAVVDQVVDSLGAGDTFNAGIIDARLRGCDWGESLAFANRLAAIKCEQTGFDNIAKRV